MSAAAVGQVYLSKADYALLCIMLSGSMAIGVYFSLSGKRQRTQEDYLLGGRHMSAIPVCLSHFATFQSAIALLGVPNEIYSYGTMYVYSIISVALSSLLAPITVVPLLYPLKITSVYEYLGLRYNSKVIQVVGAMFGIVITLSYMTIALLSPALALETAVGMPLWLSIIVVGCVGTIYTTIGGIKSVIWTDVFQTFFIFIGIFMVLIKGCIDAGGFSRVWDINKDTGHIVFDDFSFDLRVRHTVWNLIFGYVFFSYSALFSQSSVQRTLSTKSMREANKVHLLNIPVTTTFKIVLIMTGLVLTGYFYAIGCDPLAAGYIKNSNQVVPYFVLHTMRSLPGLAGLYISTIFSGALSTLSSGINSLAANTVEDFLTSFLRNKSEFVTTSITKLLVCFYGSAAVGFAYVAQDFQGPVSQMTYTALGAITGPLLGLFLLSATFPQANYVGAILGCCLGLITTMWQAIGAFKFGYSTETLQRGPSNNCIVDEDIHLLSLLNETSYLTSPPFAFVANSTESITEIHQYTVSSPVYFGQIVNASNLQDRDFSIYDISYIYNPIIGVFVVILGGLVFSCIANMLMLKKMRPEAKYLFPFCRRFWYTGNDVVSREVKLNKFGDENE
ncbi:sodium-coupled monocarboxylate transporter 1 [Plakobranchus ocellatus]|uniref:Sodium-coupled monocarboxylate transporter 1 n=1 Tax=Plakobranchus ocellatus TaxID=259542 RepID=A0AAV4DCQ3_9GAST|nr:sodium-coupled monocarboxylate transporter 1 [Plakobranchus ocellatus]